MMRIYSFFVCMILDKLYVTSDLDSRQVIRLLTKYYNPEAGKWTQLEKRNFLSTSIVVVTGKQVVLHKNQLRHMNIFIKRLFMSDLRKEETVKGQYQW